MPDMIASQAGLRRTRVLFALPELGAGGPDRVMFELITHLPRDRFLPLLMVGRRGGRYFDMLPADVEIHVAGGGRRYPVRAYARLVDSLKPDIVFTTLRMNLTAGLGSFVHRHRPVLIERQANAIAADFAILRRSSLIKHRVAEWLVKLALRRADWLVAQSADMGAELRGAMPAARRGRVVVIGNPVDIASVEQAAKAQHATVLRGSPALLGVGRLMPQKGFDVLIDALPAVLAAHPGAHLTLLGEGPDRAALAARAAALGVGDRVTMPGHAEGVLATIAGADLFVSSSRYEGFSNAILEAIALGVPVAATDCPGATREMITEGESGFLAPRQDPVGLSAAIGRALASDRVAVAARARAHVSATFGRDRIVSAYAALFDRARG